MNKNCRLKLNAYDKTKDGSANLVYGAKLDTEGIFFEISQKKIIEWLRINQIIREEQVPDLNDDLAVKKWFAEYVHSDEISMFGDVDENESIEYDRTCNIGGKSAKRGKVQEYIFTNIPGVMRKEAE